MNKKFTNRVDNIYKIFNMLLSNSASRFIEIEKLAMKIEKISGYTLEQLLKLFAVGYTLKPPELKGYNVMLTILDETVGDEHD